MKQLRILTGLHSGAQLTLKRRQYRIAGDDKADIQITDWDQAALILVTEDKGDDVLLTLHYPGSDGAPARLLGALEDFVPKRFNDVVLCAGPSDAAWPSDVMLMSRLMRKADSAKAQSSLRTGRVIGASVAAGFTLIACLSALLAGPHATSAVAPLAPLAVRVQQSLQQAGVTGITVREADRRVVIEGLLATTADVARVRSLLQPFGDGVMMHRYSAASDVVRSITDALGGRSLQVSYRGAGVFSVSGVAPQLERLREDVKRVAADLGPAVARIDVNAVEAPPTQRIPVGSMMAGQGFQYVQTADGTKHLLLAAGGADDTTEGRSSASLPTSQP